MDNLKKFNTEADYSAATLNYPAVSYIVNDDVVHYDKSGKKVDIKATYNVTATTEDIKLYVGAGEGSGSGSGSGGGFTPLRMWIDGVEETPSATWAFTTTGEHIVEYELQENDTTIPEGAFKECYNLIEIEVADNITEIGELAFYYCYIDNFIIHSVTPPTLVSDSAFMDTPIAHGEGYINVPAESVTAYQSATNWNFYSSQIRAIS